MMCEVRSPIPAPGQLSITPLEGRTGLRLAGEADLWSMPALRRAVAELPADTQEIHLQLAGLKFVDVAAARFLITLTERPGHPEVIFQYPPPVLIRLIGLLCPADLTRSLVQDAGSWCPASWSRASSGSPELAGPWWREDTAGGQV